MTLAGLLDCNGYQLSLGDIVRNCWGKGTTLYEVSGRGKYPGTIAARCLDGSDIIIPVISYGQKFEMSFDAYNKERDPQS